MVSSRVIHAEAHTSIRRPVAVVFRWLTDPALVPLWVTGLVASQPVGGAEVRLGARSVEEISVRGRTITMPAETHAGLRPHVASVLDDLGDACTLTHTLAAEMSDHRLIPSTFIAAGMKRQIRGDLAGLTRLVEAAP